MMHAPAAAQLRPQDLPEGESWTNPCPVCPEAHPNAPVVTQGGLAGLRAHQLTVHPDQLTVVEVTRA